MFLYFLSETDNGSCGRIRFPVAYPWTGIWWDYRRFRQLWRGVFCGFGEPTERIDVLPKVARYFKETYHKPIRINTNGLGNLVNGRDIAPDFKGLIDTISISLNTPNADRYHELVRSRFGDQSFQAMLDFAKECTHYVPNVVMTTVQHWPKKKKPSVKPSATVSASHTASAHGRAKGGRRFLCQHWL